MLKEETVKNLLKLYLSKIISKRKEGLCKGNEIEFFIGQVFAFSYVLEFDKDDFFINLEKKLLCGDIIAAQEFLNYLD